MLRIVASSFTKSAVKPGDFPFSKNYDIAFSGKSNVGKSSMINTLLNRKAIAKISSTPGKTRLLNFFEIQFKIDDQDKSGSLNFVDLPGYGYAKVSKLERENWRKMVTGYFNNRQQIKGVVVLIDIRHKADPKDMMMIDLLKAAGIPFIVAATKADKIAKAKISHNLKKLASQHQVEKANIIAFSSLKKFGISQLLGWIEQRIQ